MFVPKVLVDYYGEQAALKQIQQETGMLPTTTDFTLHGPSHVGRVVQNALELVDKYPQIYGKNINKGSL